VKRRQFITLLGGATAWPLAAHAQQRPALAVIGLLQSAAPEEMANRVAAFRKALSENGYEEGRNLAIEYRWARYDNTKLPELAAELVRRRVVLIATPGSTPAAVAAKAATTTIPVVFGVGLDPVETGLVTSFNRPGGNVTGYTTMNAELTGRQLGLLHELLPAARRFAVLINPNNPIKGFVAKEAQEAGAIICREIIIVAAAAANRDINAAFATLKERQVDALVVADALFDSRRSQLAVLAARHTMPSISFERTFPEAGGLMSYGSSLGEG
jgi:putative ABC transport system substrate-binding protein